MFSYSGRVKSPEWRWQRRRADLRHLEIFRHGPIIIYTRLPAGGTYYPICTFPASSECLIGISDAFSVFCLRVSVIFPTCSLYPHKSVPTLHYTCRHGPIYTGPCLKALTECSPLDFQRSSIKQRIFNPTPNAPVQLWSCWLLSETFITSWQTNNNNKLSVSWSLIKKNPGQCWWLDFDHFMDLTAGEL